MPAEPATEPGKRFVKGPVGGGDGQFFTRNILPIGSCLAMVVIYGMKEGYPEAGVDKNLARHRC
jgi:hypothetical protein